MAPVTMISCEAPGESSRSLERVTLSCFSCVVLQELSPDCSAAWHRQLSREAAWLFPGSACAPSLMPPAEEWSSRLGRGEGLVPVVGGGGLRQPCHRLVSGQEKRRLALIILEVFSNLNASVIP